MIAAIEQLMVHDTAGDPITGLKWTHKTTAQISRELRGVRIDISPNTVARLLKGLGYSLRVNHKKIAGKSHPCRDQQFRQIRRVEAVRQEGTIGHAGQRVAPAELSQAEVAIVPGALWRPIIAACAVHGSARLCRLKLAS